MHGTKNRQKKSMGILKLWLACPVPQRWVSCGEVPPKAKCCQKMKLCVRELPQKMPNTIQV